MGATSPSRTSTASRPRGRAGAAPGRLAAAPPRDDRAVQGAPGPVQERDRPEPTDLPGRPAGQDPAGRADEPAAEGRPAVEALPDPPPAEVVETLRLPVGTALR